MIRVNYVRINSEMYEIDDTFFNILLDLYDILKLKYEYLEEYTVGDYEEYRVIRFDFIIKALGINNNEKIFNLVEEKIKLRGKLI